MKFMLPHADLPPDERLLQLINSGAELLYSKLSVLDFNSLNISDYNKFYLEKIIRNLRRWMQKYSYILAWTLYKHPSSFKEFTLIDYSGGSGVYSMMAKAVGIGTVVYNDIYEVSCQDAKKIAQE